MRGGGVIGGDGVRQTRGGIIRVTHSGRGRVAVTGIIPNI